MTQVARAKPAGSVADDLASAPAGRIVRVRLPLDLKRDWVTLIIADGQGGYREKKMSEPSDIPWLAEYDPKAAEALARMMDKRAEEIQSREWHRKVAAVRAVQRQLADEAWSEWWGLYWGPYVEVFRRGGDVLSWVADFSAQDVGGIWQVFEDATMAVVEVLQQVAKKTKSFVLTGLKVVGVVAAGGGVIWLLSKWQPRQIGAR